VLEGLDFFAVFWLLMARRWQRLAAAFVRLPEAPVRDEQQVVLLLRERVSPEGPSPAREAQAAC